jgi:hypothetical protein
MKRQSYKDKYIKLFFKHQKLLLKMREAKRHIDMVRSQIRSWGGGK